MRRIIHLLVVIERGGGEEEEKSSKGNRKEVLRRGLHIQPCGLDRTAHNPCNFTRQLCEVDYDVNGASRNVTMQ